MPCSTPDQRKGDKVVLFQDARLVILTQPQRMNTTFKKPRAPISTWWNIHWLFFLCIISPFSRIWSPVEEILLAFFTMASSRPKQCLQHGGLLLTIYWIDEENCIWREWMLQKRQGKVVCVMALGKRGRVPFRSWRLSQQVFWHPSFLLLK